MKPTSVKAFTLVETVLALAIFIFAFFTTMAMLPIAISTHYETVCITAEAHIFNFAKAQVLQTEPDAIEALDNNRFYFDRYGNEKHSAGPDTFYVLEIQVLPATGQSLRRVIFTLTRKDQHQEVGFVWVSIPKY